MEQKIILEKMYEKARECPNKLCVLEKERRITYSQYWNAVSHCAAYLTEKGICKGTRVTIASEQTAVFLMAVSAIHLAGAVAVPLEKNLPVQRIVEIMKMMDTAWIVGRNLNMPEGSHFISFDHLEHWFKECESEQQSRNFPEGNALADILFTTGTTGMPKGIQVTHFTNIAIAENVIDSVELAEDEVELIPTPINHSLGLRRYYGAMYRGSTIGIIDGVIYVEDFFDMLKKYNMTAITLVPTMLSILMKFSKNRLGEFDHQLRFIQIGSAPLLKEEKQELCTLLPDVRLYNTYGATEAGCSCILEFSKLQNKMFCIGRPTVNATVGFVDDGRKVINATKENPGYLFFEGPMNMSGYWMEPELTKEVLQDGKIFTNDIGYRGEDGYIYLLGRKDEVINSGGNKIAPLEIEETMQKHTKVDECACVPVKDPVAGQMPKLYVVMKPGEQFCQEELIRFLSQRLEFFKIPRQIEELDKLPRAYNGKLLRKELREREEKKNG